MKLRNQHVTCGRLHLRIRFSDFKSDSIGRKLPVHTQDAIVLTSMVHQLYNQLQQRRIRIRHRNRKRRHWHCGCCSGSPDCCRLSSGVASSCAPVAGEIYLDLGFTALLSLVILSAICFTTAYHPFPFQYAACFGNYRRLAFMAVALIIKHYPIMRRAQAVCLCCIGK